MRLRLGRRRQPRQDLPAQHLQPHLGKNGRGHRRKHQPERPMGCLRQDAVINLEQRHRQCQRHQRDQQPGQKHVEDGGAAMPAYEL